MSHSTSPLLNLCEGETEVSSDKFLNILSQPREGFQMDLGKNSSSFFLLTVLNKEIFN
jgi:hypothetical protein